MPAVKLLFSFSKLEGAAPFAFASYARFATWSFLLQLSSRCKNLRATDMPSSPNRAQTVRYKVPYSDAKLRFLLFYLVWVARLAVLSLAPGTTTFAASVITTRLDDPKAVYLSQSEFGARGDGSTDDSAAIQAAIDKAEGNAREGIVFIPSGSYRLTRTIYIWPGVRVFGYGATRPVLVLADKTPGFQSGMGVMVMFTGRPPGGMAGRAVRVAFQPPGSEPPNDSIADANSGTFYSAMSNIDFTIGDGNPAAVCIRFHVAHHAVLRLMDFLVGSGLAALNKIGNVAEYMHFYGGRYGILT
jgi:hypothetical protein